eukprot:scaffold22753_cov108-Isochrysis_galbana.AAC.1
MLAARNGSTAAAEALVAGGAGVNAVTPAGTTVLMHAVANGSAPLVGMLLKVRPWCARGRRRWEEKGASAAEGGKYLGKITQMSGKPD